jgi:hypothetical protein
MRPESAFFAVFLSHYIFLVIGHIFSIYQKNVRTKKGRLAPSDDTVNYYVALFSSIVRM